MKTILWNSEKIITYKYIIQIVFKISPITKTTNVGGDQAPPAHTASFSFTKRSGGLAIFENKPKNKIYFVKK